MSLVTIIADCTTMLEKAGKEFDADDVIEIMYRDHADEISVEFGAGKIRSAVRQRVCLHLKRRAAEDPNSQYDQVCLAGFDTAPCNVPFYDGHKVRYIPTLSAKTSHLLSAIKLRKDNIGFCEMRNREYLKMLDYINQHGGDITFGEAIIKTDAALNPARCSGIEVVALKNNHFC